jgi:hydrogenase nickel incorporation protein HypA/HybF
MDEGGREKRRPAYTRRSRCRGFSSLVRSWRKGHFAPFRGAPAGRQNGPVHELSMAISLVELACEKTAGLGDVRVEALHLRLGALSGVVREALVFSFDVAAAGTPLAGARLVIEDVPLTVRCPRCAEERELAGFPLVCPVCETPTPEVVRGKDLELTALEVQEHAAANR